MSRDLFTFLVGGKAGEGVKQAGTSAARLFAQLGRYVFEYDDYPSLIRGGHNFTVVSSSTEPLYSHYLTAQIAVVLDKRSYDAHLDHFCPDCLLVRNLDEVPEGAGIGLPISSEAKKYPNAELRRGLGAVVALAAAVGMDEAGLEAMIHAEYSRDVENNLAFAKGLFVLAQQAFGGKFTLSEGKAQGALLTGNEAIALGAASAGLDCYFSYPMTPSSSILHYLAAHDQDLGLVVMHPENEISVANLAVGAAAMGARSAVASSGGGFALMEETFSLAGMMETPLLAILSSRPGPATGVPTYSEQGDLEFALHQGHGEFPRVVASPGSVEEAFTLSADLLDLAWRYQVVAILLTEKHLGESLMTTSLDPEACPWAEPALWDGQGQYKRYLDTESAVSPMAFPPSEELINHNSYEHDELGITTENAEQIAQMHSKRLRKAATLESVLKQRQTVNVFGEEGPVIFTYGSTTLAAREAVALTGLKAQIVQPIYLCPLPLWELARFAGQPSIVVEQSASGQFARLLAEKAGLKAERVIRRYDGRPFEPTELAQQLREVL